MVGVSVLALFPTVRLGIGLFSLPAALVETAAAGTRRGPRARTVG